MEEENELEVGLNKLKDKSQVHSYNEALLLTGLGKFHYCLLVVSGFCLMSVIIETLNMGFIIPFIDYECDIILSLTHKGLLNSSVFAGVCISSYFFGYLADRKGRTYVMTFCASLSFLFSLTSSFSINVWMLITTRFFVGFFISGLAANTYAYLGEFHSDKNRARHLNFSGFFMALGLMFCPALAWIILKIQGISTNESPFIIPFINIKYSIWRIFLLICSTISFINMIALYFLPESPKFLLAQNKHDEALKILQKVHKINSGSNHFYAISKIELDEQLLNNIESEDSSFFKILWKQTSPLFKKPLGVNTLKLSILMFGVFSTSSSFFMWTPEILSQIEQLNYPVLTVCEVMEKVMFAKKNTSMLLEEDTCSKVNVNAKIYEITFFMGIVFSLVFLINGFLIKKICNEKCLLAIWFSICGLSILFLPFTNNFYLIILFLVVFMSSGCCGSLNSAISVEIFPTSIRAVGLCTVLMIGRMGAIAGNIFVSHMIANSCNLMFIIYGILLLFCAVLSISIKKTLQSCK